MANLNRFKFTFGKKSLTLTSEHDNLFMEEIAKVAQKKYQAIKRTKCLVQMMKQSLFCWQSTVCQLNSAVRLNLMYKEQELEELPSQARDL